MKTFKEFIAEEQCKFPAFYVSRSNMPQIKTISQFESHVNSFGVETEYKFVNAAELRTTQTDYDQSKVDSIVADSQITSKAIIISADGYILDGHHRALAAAQKGVEVEALVVNLPINKLLKLAMEYTESYG